MFDIALSVPLVLEYEDVCLRQCGEIGMTPQHIGDIVDYLCSVAKQQPIFFLWRPILKDPKDDMVLELAFAAGSDAIVTYNTRNFEEASSLGLRIIRPQQFLREIGI